METKKLGDSGRPRRRQRAAQPPASRASRSEASFLAGKVRKQVLPVVQGAPPPEAPMLKRLKLAQGELAHIYDGAEGMRYIAYVELRAGTVRGNHYHKHKAEVMYVIRGEVLLQVEDIASKAQATFTLRGGELAVLPTGVAHAFRTLQAGQAIEFSSSRFNAADVFRYPLISLE